MSDATAAPELDPVVEAEIEKIENITKKGFDLKARLQGRGLRSATVVLYLDEVTGAELGFAEDRYHPTTGVKLPGRNRAGVIGELEARREMREMLVKDHEAKASAAKVTGESEIGKAAKKPVPLDTKDIDEAIAVLEAKEKALLAELERTGITVKMRAVPPVIQKDARRKAKATLGINGKKIPEDVQELFVIAESAHLMSVLIQSVTDNETGDVNSQLDYDDAIALIDLLPSSQFARLDETMGKVQFTDAISRSIESQEDFS